MYLMENIKDFLNSDEIKNLFMINGYNLIIIDNEIYLENKNKKITEVMSILGDENNTNRIRFKGTNFAFSINTNKKGNFYLDHLLIGNIEQDEYDFIMRNEVIDEKNKITIKLVDDKNVKHIYKIKDDAINIDRISIRKEEYNDEDLFEELEEVLIMADLGVETTMNIIENLRKRVKKEHITDPQAIRSMLIEEITAILQQGVQNQEKLPSPTVMLIIGVNGVGKTTTIGKLSYRFKEQGKSILLGAADTFRAAAIEQLEIWGQRAGIDVIKHQQNSDPAAVVFDAVNAAKNRKIDLLICDTAGRLHNKKNLMEELKKIAKVIDREYPQAHKEVYLVLDATTGQNAMQQAKLFKEVADITGIILTKLDGTAKGGIVIAIQSELKVPVRYIGVGEGIDDLQEFNAKEFAEALFGD